MRAARGGRAPPPARPRGTRRAARTRPRGRRVRTRSPRSPRRACRASAAVLRRWSAPCHQTSRRAGGMMRVTSISVRGGTVPVFELTYPEGALEPEARTRLMDDLTTALLRAERAPDTEFFRSVTWSYVHELPAGSVLAAGSPVDRPTFRIDVTTPEGALSDRRREELVGEATRLVREAAGIV